MPLAHQLLVDFKKRIWDLAESKSKLDLVLKYAQYYQVNKKITQNSERYAGQFSWLCFLNLLTDNHRKYLNINKQIEREIKQRISKLADFPSEDFINLQLSLPCFNFLAATEKPAITNVLLATSQIATAYKKGELHDAWDCNAEDWIIQSCASISTKVNLKNMPWILAKTLNQLNYNCIFSYNGAQAFIKFSNQINKDRPYNDYIIWTREIKALDPHDYYTLDFVSEFLLQDSLFYKELMDGLFSNSKLFKNNLSTKRNLLNRYEEKISNTDIVNFLYRTDLNNFQNDDYLQENLFENLEKDFLPYRQFGYNTDWISFWRGVALFGKRYSQFIYKQKTTLSNGVILDSPQKVYSWFCNIYQNNHQESLWCIVLDNKNSIKNSYEVFRGTVNQTIAHPREIFALAIENRSTSIVLIHNHPSGDPRPSVSDQEITTRMQESGNILGINLLDHIIIGKNSCYSFNEGIFEFKD